MSVPIGLEDISDWEDNRPPHFNNHRLKFSPEHLPKNIPKHRLTKTRNSKVYFSDSDDPDESLAFSHRLRNQPLTQPLNLTKPRAHTVRDQTPNSTDDKPCTIQQQTFRTQQQHHRRHRQFHRTFTPLDLRQLNCSEDSSTPSSLGALTPTHSCNDTQSACSVTPDRDWPDHQQPPTTADAPRTGIVSVSGSPRKTAPTVGPIPESPKQRRYRKMLLNYGAEVIGVLALILTTLATYQNAPPKISKLSAAQPFFTKTSLVHDYPAGNLYTVQDRVKMSDVSMIMFYAPWSAECQFARHSYEQVARLFYREVHFGAVNCWQPDGECRQQYAKIHDWPVAMAYLNSGLAVPYFGRWSVASLTKFLRALMQPLHRIIDNDDMLRLMMSHDAVVVAFLDVDQHVEDYAAFYSTAVKWLEQDPFQSVAFGVVTGASMTNFGVDRPLVRTYLWNGTMEYDTQNVWTQPKLTSWIKQQIIRVSVWLNPPGVKASTLAPHLKDGPSLMLFTPRNMDSTKSIDAYDMLRQLALEYHNCQSVNQPWIEEMSRVYITEMRKENRKEFADFAEQCDQIIADAERTKSVPKCRFQSSCDTPVRSVSHIMNSSKLPVDFCQIGPRNVDENVDSCSYLNRPLNDCPLPDDRESIVTSMLNAEGDPRSPINLSRQSMRKRCEIFARGEKREEYPGVRFFETANDWDEFGRVSELACAVNRTMSFVAVDSTLYHVFAQRLGVDVHLRSDETVAIIVDPENESTYVMNEPVTTIGLIDFVQNFTRRELPRFLNARGDDLPDKRSNGTRPMAANPKQYSSAYKRPSGTVKLRDVDSHTFSQTVLNSKKTVFMMFHSAQCAMCSVLAQALLMAAHSLSDLRTHVDFVRIDGDRNDLPWAYTIDQYPTLIVFPPMQHAMDSRVFPASLPATVPNVLAFVLANLRRPLRLHALLLVCDSSRKHAPTDDCARTIRREISDSIAISLRQWRSVPHRRTALLRRLQALQRIYLQLHQFDRIDATQRNHLISLAGQIVKLWPTPFNHTEPT